VGDITPAPWTRAILNFQSAHRTVRAMGVDSASGTIIATALELRPDLVRDDADHALANELRWRLGIEGRTRYALSRIAFWARENRRAIFFQGLFHRDGVHQWCNRNGISFEERRPPSVPESPFPAS